MQKLGLVDHLLASHRNSIVLLAHISVDISRTTYYVTTTRDHDSCYEYCINKRHAMHAEAMTCNNVIGEWSSSETQGQLVAAGGKKSGKN